MSQFPCTRRVKLAHLIQKWQHVALASITHIQRFAQILCPCISLRLHRDEKGKNSDCGTSLQLRHKWEEKETRQRFQTNKTFQYSRQVGNAFRKMSNIVWFTTLSHTFPSIFRLFCDAIKTQFFLSFLRCLVALFIFRERARRFLQSVFRLLDNLYTKSYIKLFFSL